MIPAAEALQRLKLGNKRFVAGDSSVEPASPATRRALVGGQEPFAIILGCADSRVPAELIFDQGLGDLFVIRVAGNIVAPSQMESVEFSAAYHGVKLVVVLGHSNCAAIQASVDELGQPDSGLSPAMTSIVGRIRPALKELMEQKAALDTDVLVAKAVRANVRASVRQLRTGSVVLQDRIAHNGLVVVGAEYALDTGVVDFIDGLPETA